MKVKLVKRIIRNVPNVIASEEEPPPPSSPPEEEPNKQMLYESEEEEDEENNERVILSEPQVIIPLKSNILNHIHGVLYDHKSRILHHESQARKMALRGYLENLQINESVSRFQRRITELSWHPKEPYFVGAGCKGGDKVFMKGSFAPNGDLKFNQKLAIKGAGPGGAIFSMRFDENRRNLVYTAGLEGAVNRYDIEHGGTLDHQFYNTNSFSHWFTSMDVSQATRTILAGCTKGRVYLSTLDGEKVLETRLHKGKVLHCEFNQLLPHLIVTSSIDKTVKLWDLRKLTDTSPLEVLVHSKPVNVAHFNPLNSSRLLTSDQHNEIRIYEGPYWNKSMTISHPHRQFQHLTAIVANWHPQCAVIVIGKYPVVPKRTKAPPRPIQFFDADTGNLIQELYPPINDIVSLNQFNPVGDVLASGQGRSLIFFNLQDQIYVLSKNMETLKRKKTGSGIQFPSRISDSDSNDEDEDRDTKEKQRCKKRKTDTVKTKSQSSGKGSKKK